MLITEVRIKGENEHVVLPHKELGRLLERGEVEGVFKYGVYGRDEPQGETKAVHTIQHPGLIEGRPTASGTITSASIDRDGDIVQTNGMLTEPYLKNPVVLPMHSHTFPVGLTERLKIMSKQAWAQWQWTVELPGSEAEQYQAWWDANALNAISVGFMPVKFGPTKEGFEGWVFEEWELLEYSPVVIPSNRDAVRALEGYGEMVLSGPSPVMKSLWKAGESQGGSKQVALGKATVDLELTATFKDRDGDEEPLVKIEDEPGDSQTEVKGAKYETFEAVKSACAAGALPVSEAFGELERILASPLGKSEVLVAPGSFTEIKRDVQQALCQIEAGEDVWTYVCVLYPGRVVYARYERGGEYSQHFERTYTRAEDHSVVFGERSELDQITVYVPHDGTGIAEQFIVAMAAHGYAAGIGSGEVDELKERAAAAEQRAEEWRTKAVLLAADVITTGGERDGE